MLTLSRGFAHKDSRCHWKINEAAAKVLGVNTFEGFFLWSFKVLTLWFSIAVAKVLTPCRFEFWVQPKMLGVKTSALKKLVGVMSHKC